MSRYFIILIIFIFSSILFGQEQKSVSLTAYNNNLGVVHEIRSIELNKGINKITVSNVAELIDPTSVHINLKAKVLEQNYQYDLVSMEKVLNKYLNQNIQLLSSNGELIEGKLLSAFGNQIVLQKKDNGLLMIPNVDKYTFSVNSLPEGLITKPSLLWLIESKQAAKEDAEITYQTRGVNWHAEYVAVLNSNDSAIDLNSWISLENTSGATFKDAKLKLVAGNVNIIQPQPRFTGMRKDMVMAEAADQFSEKEFFEYHIYDLQKPTTISNNETKQISLFEASGVNVVKKYIYSNQSNNKVNVFIEFDNSDKNNLGMPFPKGKVRVYKSDGKNSEFIGEDIIEHTPKNEKIKLRLGDAFDLVAEEIQKENKRITDRVSEQVWEIKLKNRKNENVVIDVERYLGNNWEIKTSNMEYVKKDSGRIVFNAAVKANSETTITYTVRYNY